jgi:hypothetical protein
MEASKEKPIGYSDFAGETLMLPRAWAYAAFPNLVHYTTHCTICFALLFFSFS